MHAFDVLGNPIRRRILELLAAGEHTSGTIVEVVQREGDGHSFLFLLNHGARAVTVEIGGGYHDALTGDPSSSEATLGPHGVSVLRRQASVDPDGVTAATVDVLGS